MSGSNMDDMKQAVEESGIEEVTLWKKTMNRVLTGITLCVITLQFWRLEHLLPAVGTMLLLLGVRDLSRENRWFRIAWIMAVLRAGVVFTMLVLNTTIFPSYAVVSEVLSVFSAVGRILLFFLLLCFWRGLDLVGKRTDPSFRAGSAGALFAWYILMYLLAIWEYQGLIVVGVMLLGYVFTVRGISRTVKDIELAGYELRPEKKRISDRRLVTVLSLTVAVGGGMGYLFGASYPMNWNSLKPAEQEMAEDKKIHLLKLGVPEYVIQDLMPEDLAACEGAIRAEVQITDESVSPYADEKEEKPLRCTSVGVQLPGNPENWMIVHHFLWVRDPGFYGTESVQIWPVYRDISEGWSLDGEITGRVLCDRDEVVYWSPYHTLGSETVTRDTMFWGTQTSSDVFGTFSMPKDGKNCRGYVAYPVRALQEGYLISSWMNYTHYRKGWIEYPVLTAKENRMKNFWDRGPFITVQHALQFYPADDNSS